MFTITIVATTALLAIRRGDCAADAASALPVGDDFHVLGVHHLGEVITNLIGDRFIENTLIAEALQIQLQALEFDAQILGDEANRHRAKVGMPGLGAGAGEFFSDVFDEKIPARGRCRETFKKLDIGHGVGFRLNLFCRYVFVFTTQSQRHRF